MKLLICFNVLLICWVHAEDVRLLDLDPPEAQSIIDSKDQTLKYAPKIESNVPAVRYLGNEPHHVQEDIYLANQYHGQDGVGGYLYGYSVPDIAKTEKKKAGGDLTGSYNYIAGDGQEIKVQYWDNGNGFHQIDNVPKILPKQIDDSPEVKAAKEEHARIWAAEAERNSKPIQNPYPSAKPGAYAGLGAGVGAGVGGYSAVSGLSQGAPKYGSPSLGPGGAQPGFAGNPGYAGQSGSFGSSGGFGGSKPGFGGSQGGAFGGSKPGFGGNQGAFGGNQGAFGSGNQGGAFGGSKPAFGGSQGAFGSGSKPGFGGAAGFGKSSQNNIDYSGQYSENQQSFAANPQAQQKNQDDGSWDESQTEEPQGPPKGFFYNIDYPVGIIVSKDGQQKRESLSEVYNSNKALFDQQLKGGAAVHGGATYPNYQVHA